MQCAEACLLYLQGVVGKRYLKQKQLTLDLMVSFRNLQSLESSGKLVKCCIELSEFKIYYLSCSAVKDKGDKWAESAWFGTGHA